MAKRKRVVATKNTPAPELEAEPLDSVEIPSPWPLMGVAGGISFLFMVAVFAFAGAGGLWVDSLDEQVGDVLAGRAQRYAERGRDQDALDFFRTAVNAHFENPALLTSASHTVAGALLDKNRFEEAVEVNRAALERDPGDSLGYNQLRRALTGLNRFEEILTVTQTWREWADAHNDNDAAGQAAFHRGTALAALGRADEAVDAFIESQDLNGSPASALSAARIMLAQERFEEAAFRLNFVIKHDKGELRDEAEKLLSRTQTKP